MPAHLAYTIREATPDDAENIIAFMKILADEPDNGTSYSSSAEFTYTVEQERNLLQQYQDADNHVWFVAEVDGQLVGYINAAGGKRAMYHTLTFGIALARDWRNQGIGTALIHHLIAWCQANPVVRRLQLTVFSNNPRAFHVYHKLGFQQEGIARAEVKKHGQFLDGILMAMLFEHDNDV